MEAMDFILKYAIAPICIMGWYMFKKQDVRIDILEKRATELEIGITKIETELHFIGRDVRDIKTAINRLIDKS